MEQAEEEEEEEEKVKEEAPSAVLYTQVTSTTWNGDLKGDNTVEQEASASDHAGGMFGSSSSSSQARS